MWYFGISRNFIHVYLVWKLTKNVVYILAVGTTEVESLKSALAKSKKEAETRKVAADRAPRL